MSGTPLEPGRLSLQAGDGSTGTRTGLVEDMSKKAAFKRMRLPRSHSTSNMLDTVNSFSSRSAKLEPQDNEGEQNERHSLRDLAKFLRTTAPPRHSTASNDNFFSLSGSGPMDRKRSIQSLIRRKRGRAPAMSLQLQPSDIQLSDRIVAKKTIEGYPYATIDLSDQGSANAATPRAQSPASNDAPARPKFHPPSWPERTSSKGALSPTFPASSGSLEGSPKKVDIRHGSTGSANDTVRGRRVTRALHSDRHSSLRDSVDGQNELQPSLRRTIPVIDQYNGMQPSPRGSSLAATQAQTGPKHQNSISQGSVVEFPATPPPSGQLRDFEWPEVKIHSVTTSPPTSPMSSSNRERQDSLPGLHSRLSSPTTPRNAAKKPPAIVVKSTLTVPSEALVPESPGFPNMLAAMTFPSPPRSSRSPSPASSLNSRAPTLSSAISPPTIRPRTSSKKANRSLSTAISLDEIVMQPTRPGLSHSQSDYITTASKGLQRPLPVDLRAAEAPIQAETLSFAAAADVMTSKESMLAADDASIVRPDSAASFVTACEDRRESIAQSVVSDTDSRRLSTSSTATYTTESYRQSTSTSDSNRQSTRSNATTASTVLSIPDDEFRKDSTSDIDYTRETFTSSPPPSESGSKQNTYDARSDYTSRLRPEGGLPPQTAIPGWEGVGKPMSIAERRMMRKGKSGEIRQQSIDLSRSSMKLPVQGPSSFESVDSPILGWFSYKSPVVRKPSFRGPSPLAKEVDASSASIVEAHESHQAESPSTLGIQKPQILQNTVPAAAPTADQSGTDLIHTPTRQEWSMSPILAEVIEPEPVPELSKAPACELTISPIMVVASVKPGVLLSPTSNLRVSTVLSFDNTSPPHLPPRSPLRPRAHTKRLSRAKLLPIKVSAVPSATIDHAKATYAQGSGRSSVPTVSPSSQARALKRLSLPAHIMCSTTSPASWDRTPPRRGHKELDREEPDTEEEAVEPEDLDPQPRRRSIVVKERFEKQKLEKEKEIADLVAKAAFTVSKREKENPSKDNVEQSSEHSRKKSRTTDELERRVRRLQRHSDAWLDVLDPLLENMTRTLKEMKKDGKGAPLLMDEFIIDMAAEARRSMLSVIATDGDATGKGPLFEDFDGAHQGASLMPQQKTVGKKRRGLKGGSKLRLQLEQPKAEIAAIASEPVQDVAKAEPEAAPLREPEVQEVVLPPPPAAQTPRTPLEHEFEAEVAVRRRIQQQEKMMDELMNRWGVPSPMPPPSGKSALQTEPGVGQEEKAPTGNSRSSSVNTVKPDQPDDSEGDTIGSSLLALKTPLTRFWVAENEGGGSRRGSAANSRRGSRRWSSAGERISWKPGDSNCMNLLMQELRETSRLSLESRGDVGSLL
ncbi:uncharacterized protein JN550_012326 [Neoarthrinium moseri]|uniref:uncharacterized protein n=1 Tax=Neoarthrinium moseri TaxID=1658444 RepID=UPI001FDE39CF|nr:uncharacterized protein JN550_012326 [Neoarthrinium moseri]KAI1858867.1 hypothetical protein JN550_012326 [Neoarthrinium moseri]